MNDISVTLSADDRALLQALREAGVSLDQFARKGAGALRDMETASHASATGIEKLAGGLKTAFIGGGVAAAIITIKNAIGGVTMAMIDAQMQADKVKNSLAFAMGGAQAAQEIQYLRQVTDQLGVSFAAVAPMYGRLAAATKGTNLEGRATREIFESIAQASVVMGLGVEETEGAMRALVQMVSKGQIQAEELRGQLGERLPRAFQIFADSMGVTTGELSKLLEMGQVGPERLAQFAATLKGEMAGNLDEATTRLAANVNRLDNAWLQLKQNVGEAGVSSFMAGQMAVLADATGDVAKSMEAARKGGDGFLGQMAAAGGALLRFANPFNAITYNVQDQATELKIAQDQLREYEALLAKDPTNTFLIRGIAQIKETVAWLQAANSEKDKFAASGPSRRTMENNSMKALAEQQAKDAKELADLKARLMGVDKDYLPTLNKLNDAYRAGNLTQKEYVGLVEELAKKNYTAAKSTATHADAFGDFVRKLNEKLAAQAQELDAGRKLTDSEKLRIQFAEELGTKYKNLSAAQLAKVDGLLKAIAAGEEQARATRRLVAAYQSELDVMAELDAAYVAASKAREQGRLAVDAYVQGIAASAEQVALEQSLFGQSTRNRAIALEQYQIELDLKKQIAAINANAGFDQSQRDEEIARATAAAAIAKASAVAKADMAALQSLFDAFDNTAHDVFVNIFNDGSNAFKKLGQSLKAGLIDVLYQLTLKRWIINIGASVTGLGGVTAANAAGGAGALGNMGSLGAGLAGSAGAASWLGLGAQLRPDRQRGISTAASWASLRPRRRIGRWRGRRPA
jgi:tape measure domain-containing protein